MSADLICIICVKQTQDSLQKNPKMYTCTKCGCAFCIHQSGSIDIINDKILCLGCIQDESIS